MQFCECAVPLKLLFLVSLGLHCSAGLLWLQGAGVFLCYGVWTSHCSSFSYCRAQALVRGLSDCSMWAQGGGVLL